VLFREGFSTERMTDHELIQEIAASNPAAYRELVERYQTTIIRTCYSLLHDQQDAEDIAQEVFIEVFMSISRFKGNSEIGTWIYRIAVNKSLNYIRSKKRNMIFERIENLFTGKENHLDSTSFIPFASEEFEETETNRRNALYLLIDALPVNQRTAFVLHKYDDLPYRKISEIMGISLSSVESLIHRAKKNLQKNIVSLYQNHSK
jgi:RNA polymerase sigma-70 factor, ECF subfamily